MSERITRRKKQAMETRARIQNSALDLFDRNGFENVSMEDVAAAAGCSVGNIYHYFKSKDELAIRVTSNVDAAYLEFVEQYRADREHTAREKLLDFVGQSLRISAQEEVLYRSFIHSLKYPEQGVLKTNDSRVYFNLLRELIASCQQEGSIRPDIPVEELLEDFLVLHRGLLFQWKISECSFDLVEHGKKMAGYLLCGLHP